MAEKMARIGLLFILLATIVAGMFIQYDCCRGAGFSHDECVYQIACEQ